MREREREKEREIREKEEKRRESERVRREGLRNREIAKYFFFFSLASPRFSFNYSGDSADRPRSFFLFFFCLSWGKVFRVLLLSWQIKSQVLGDHGEEEYGFCCNDHYYSYCWVLSLASQQQPFDLFTVTVIFIAPLSHCPHSHIPHHGTTRGK